MMVERGSICIAGHVCARPIQKVSTLEFELTQFQDVACPGVYLFGLEARETARTELFHGEAAHDGAIDHGAAHCGVILLAAACQIAHKAASERIAGSGGVVRLFEGECRHAE